jgi:hypothetical protein
MGQQAPYKPANEEKVKRTISIAVASALLCSTVKGMEFRKEADRNPGQFSIYATGQIAGDSNTFEKLATDGPHDIVFFKSPGGSLGEGLAIGAVIREHHHGRFGTQYLLFGLRLRMAWGSGASSRRRRRRRTVMLRLSMTTA